MLTSHNKAYLSHTHANLYRTCATVVNLFIAQTNFCNCTALIMHTIFSKYLVKRKDFKK